MRKRPEPLLPAKPAFDPFMIVDEIAGIVFDISHQIRKRCHGFQSEEDVYVIFHAIDDDRFVSFILDNPRHVFEHFTPPLLMKKILPALHSEDDLNVDLRVSSCHGCDIIIVIELPALQSRRDRIGLERKYRNSDNRFERRKDGIGIMDNMPSLRDWDS